MSNDKSPDPHVIPSTVAIMQHPIHPMAVVYPIALLSLVLPSDLVFWFTGDPFWARVSYWLVLGGLVMGLFAGSIGMIDFFTMKRVRSHVSGWSHFISAIVLLALAGANLQQRWVDHEAAVLPWGVMLSAAMAVVVGVTGWLGGTLTFGHAIGSFEHEQDNEHEGADAPPGQ
jgi:uncharacterized membrane protein